MAGGTAPTFLNLVAGKIKQMTSVIVGGSGAQANQIIATDVNGRIDQSFLPSGVGPEIIVVPAGEALAMGDFVHITTNTGTTALAVKATASSSSGAAKPAVGFVIAAVGSGGSANIYTVSQTNTVLTSLVPGTEYWLSNTTPGAITQTPPTTSRDVVQYIGKANSNTSIVFANVITVELA